MIPLGHGKFVRSDRIVMMEPIPGADGRGGGQRTRVWVEGITEPVVASRTERAILDDMDRGPARRARRARAADTVPALF